MNSHQQRDEEIKPQIGNYSFFDFLIIIYPPSLLTLLVTSPSAEVKEEKVPVTCPVYSTVTGEVVAEIKSDEPVKIEGTIKLFSNLLIFLVAYSL